MNPQAQPQLDELDRKACASLGSAQDQATDGGPLPQVYFERRELKILSRG